MDNIVLCGHTGSMNRGCEAIVRSTSKLLKQSIDVNIQVMSAKPAQDRELNLSDEVDIIKYPQKNIFLIIMGYIAREIFNNGIWGNFYYYKELFKGKKKPKMIFNIGGDTYCYGTPYISYALNLLAQDNNVPSVFWGCSIDESVLTNQQMQEDINRYAHILVRESISYEILKGVVCDETKLHLVCDPAFHLEMKKIELPPEFMVGQCLGINLSPMVFKDKNDYNDMTYKSFVALINYVLEKTQLSVCLIPHVYNVEACLQDYYVLSNIYKLYVNNPRVCMIDKELNCMQLKYCISKCRYFIGARTHSVIAAYSTMVPTIALSYSVKSRGIAKDIMGKEDGYVISWKEIDCEDKLIELFVNILQQNENQIKQRYSQILPAYKQSIIEQINQILRS